MAAFPIVPGYSLSGTVIESASDVKNVKSRDKVFSTGTIDAVNVNIAWGGHISHAICKAEEVTLIPDGVQLLDACTTSLAAIAFHGMRLSCPQAHEKIIVIGLGIIGRLSAYMHCLSGAEVIACDASPERVEMARK